MALARPKPAERRAPQLVERDEALATLRTLPRESASGPGRLVLIRGEAGIGKTALVNAFIADCPSEVNVFWGACDGVSTPQPYGPFEDMADALGPEFRRLLDAGAARGELGRWLLKWMSARAAAGPGHRRRPLGRSGHARSPGLPGEADRVASGPAARHPSRRRRRRPERRPDPRRRGLAADPSTAAAEPLSRAGVERLASRDRGRCQGAPPDHRRQSFLRPRGPGVRAFADPDIGAGCRSGEGWPAR